MKCIKMVKNLRAVNGMQFRTNFPCGQCLPCRVMRKKELILRLSLEARSNYQTWYVTLTYNQAHLPPGGNLVPKDLQDFLKRLRKNTKYTFRYLACGEYGDDKGRPHYHLIIFADREIPFEMGYCRVRKKVTCLKSPFIDAWSKDNISFGFADVIPILSDQDGARIYGYVVGYVLESLTTHKQIESGLEPEFLRMSRKLGYREIPKIVKMLKSHSVGTQYIEGVKITNDLQMIKFGGKLYPLGRYMREKILLGLGGEKVTKLQKALRSDRAIILDEMATDFDKQEEELRELEARGRKAYRRYKLNRKL